MKYEEMSRKADSKSEKKKKISIRINLLCNKLQAARTLYFKQGPDVGFLFV